MSFISRAASALNAAGALLVQEVLAPVAEDNTNGIYAVSPRPLTVSTYSWSKDQDFGSAAAKSVKASAGNLGSIHAFNGNATDVFFQLHNLAAAPAPGAVPFAVFVVANGTAISVGSDWFGATGLHFSVGIAWGWSTTLGTYTAGTAADHGTLVLYK